MANTSINIQTDLEVMKQAEKLFGETGMSLSSAVNLFLRQSIQKQTITLDLTSQSSCFDERTGNLSNEVSDKSDTELLDLFGKIQFAEGYDYKAFREGR